MKIAIPVHHKSLTSSVASSLGRAPFFLFYNTVTKESYYLDNSAVASKGGAGVRVAEVIADHGVKALLTPRCGENPELILRKAEVIVYKSIPGTAQQNITAFAMDELALLDDFQPRFHNAENHSENN